MAHLRQARVEMAHLRQARVEVEMTLLRRNGTF
jgi:hypothetical protein